MFKKILMASVAVSALALNAPVAHAEPAAAQCRFNTVAQEDVTGGQDTFTGVAEGIVVSNTPTNAVSITCVVTVNNVDVASTPTGTGTGAATTAGQVTYTAADADARALCAVWTDGTDSGRNCVPVTTTQIPPQVVIDLITLITSIPDPIICPILASLSPGVPGVVDIAADGDVAVAGIGIWDCPPYQV